MDAQRIAEILEVIMVVSFGVSWPLSIIKSLKAKTAKGKSLLFMLLILFGYVAGISAKFISGNITYVVWFYILNFFIVGTDIIVYFRNRRLDKIADAELKKSQQK